MDFGYLLDVDADDTEASSIGAKLRFQWQPSDLGSSHDSGFKTIAIPGHSHGLQQFGGGGPLEERLKLTFVGDDSDPAWAQDRGDWLMALTHPEFDGSGNFVREPHTVLYVVGRWKNLRCKVLSVKLSTGATFDKDTRYPRVVHADVVLTRFEPKAIDFRAVRP